jgi:hypothetical protein
VRRDLLILFLGALILRALSAWPIQQPGYMDAAYYAGGALSLYQGRGFNLPVVWNYLDASPGTESADGASGNKVSTDVWQPSHLYWMPLSSMLAYVSFLLFGPTYRAAQLPFALLSAFLPVIAYLVAYDVACDTSPPDTARGRRHALCAALFALFSGFYVAFWVVPDAFAPFAVAGGLCLWALGRALGPGVGRALGPGVGRALGPGVGRGLGPGLAAGHPAWFALSGLCAGLAHLARADGILLLVTALLAGLIETLRHLARVDRRRQAAPLAWRLLLLVACYLLVMAPWYARNVRVVGRPLSTTGLRTLWLTEYDDLYSYGKPLTWSSYLAWGWGNIVRSKLRALWLNAQTLAVVGWMIFLAPFGAIGVWRLRRSRLLRPAWIYGLLLYLTMSLAFTFPGWRGGMLHSTTALLPTLYAAAVEGLDAFVAWVSRRRPTWQPQAAVRFFCAGLVAFAVLLSAGLYIRGLERYQGPHLYDRVAAWMNAQGTEDARTMVNDPASFYYHSRQASLAIPNADRDTVYAVMEAYDVDYLLLDANNPSLRALYDAPESDERLDLVRSFGDHHERAYLLRRKGSDDREAAP